jgi:hypothetical protein
VSKRRAQKSRSSPSRPPKSLPGLAGKNGGKLSKQEPARRRAYEALLQWSVGVISTVLAGLAIWGLQQHLSRQSRSGSPVHVAFQSVERNDLQGNTWVFPQRIDLTDSELVHLNETRQDRTGTAYKEWARSHGGVDPNVSILKLVLEGNRNHTVRVVDLRTIAKCQAPLDGTILYSPPAGADTTEAIGFDLDSTSPVAQHFDGRSLSGNYFIDKTIGLRPDEQQTVVIYSMSKNHYCEYSLALTVLDDGKTTTQTITNHGEPFRVTATLPRTKEAPVGSYRSGYMGGVANVSGDGTFVRAAGSTNPVPPNPTSSTAIDISSAGAEVPCLAAELLQASDVSRPPLDRSQFSVYRRACDHDIALAVFTYAVDNPNGHVSEALFRNVGGSWNQLTRSGPALLPSDLVGTGVSYQALEALRRQLRAA